MEQPTITHPLNALPYVRENIIVQATHGVNCAIIEKISLFMIYYNFIIVIVLFVIHNL
jgi:hypothetical protein